MTDANNKFHCIVGPSGVGKTATLLRTLALRWGIYFEAYVYVKSSSKLTRTLHLQLQETRGRAAVLRAFRAMQLAFLLVLEAFRNVVSTATPFNWMGLMLSASSSQFALHAAIDALLTGVFCDCVAIAADVGVTVVTSALEKLRGELECSIVFVDEAQQFLNTALYGTHASINGTLGRPVLSLLFEAIDGVVVSGTGYGAE